MAALTACCSPDAMRLALLLPSHSAEANWIDGGVMALNRDIHPDVLRPLLYESTNVEAYPPCRAVKHAVIVAARKDGFVPLWSSKLLQSLLVQQGVPTELRLIPGGHVEAFLAHQVDFARAL